MKAIFVTVLIILKSNNIQVRKLKNRVIENFLKQTLAIGRFIYTVTQVSLVY